MSVPADIESIDQTFFTFINHDLINRFFDILFPLLREFTYVFWVILIIFFWYRRERRLAVLMSVGIIAGAIFTYPLKFIIDRERPYEQLQSARTLTPPETDPSFPSGHAEMSFLASTIVAGFHPEYRKYLYSFSLIVAVSRVYVGVHFPFDVIGGIVIGILIGKMIIYLEKRKNSNPGSH